MNITHKQVILALTALSALGSIAVLANFFHHRKLKDEILKLDHEFKLLQVEKAKSSMPR